VFVTGAELFAKRRKKSEKWVVDETTVKTTTTSTTSGSSPGSMPMPVPSYLSDGAAKAQSITKMNEIQVSQPQPEPYLCRASCVLNFFDKTSGARKGFTFIKTE